jgi:elongation factor P
LKSGSSTEVRFSSTENIERASLEDHEMEYLYSDGDMHYFMNTENYEQIALDVESLGDSMNYLTVGTKIKVQFFDGAPMGVELPPAVELTVVETAPELKGATASNSPKPAKLETGVSVQVPPFIKEGDRIRVDPSKGVYLERAK